MKGKKLFTIVVIVAAVAQVVGGWMLEYERASIECGPGVVFYTSIDNQEMFFGILLRLALIIVLSFFVSRGQRCAKWLLAQFFLIWSYRIISDLLSEDPSLKISGNIPFWLIIVLIYGAAGVIILFSKEIRAYIEAEKRQHYRRRRYRSQSIDANDEG